MTERQELVLSEEYESQPIDEETVTIIINFMYTGVLSDAGVRLPSVLALAFYLQIDDIVQICCERLCRNLDEDNCMMVWEWATRHMEEGFWWKKLQEGCNEYIKHNIEASFGDSPDVKQKSQPQSVPSSSVVVNTTSPIVSPSKRNKSLRKRKTVQSAKNDDNQKAEESSLSNGSFSFSPQSSSAPLPPSSSSTSSEDFPASVFVFDSDHTVDNTEDNKELSFLSAAYTGLTLNNNNNNNTTTTTTTTDTPKKREKRKLQRKK